MHILRMSIVSVLLLLGPGVVLAADVPVRYTVDAKALKLAVMGTPLSFELHATSACSAAISTSVVLAENVASIEQLKLLSPKGAPKPPKTARLGHVLTGVEPGMTA